MGRYEFGFVFATTIEKDAACYWSVNWNFIGRMIMLKMITGSIRNKLLLAVASACLLVTIALGVALVSLESISNSFVTFVEQDQERLQAFSNM